MKTVFSLFVIPSPYLLLLKLAATASLQESCVQLHTISVHGGISFRKKKKPQVGSSPFPLVCSTVVVSCVTPSIAGTRRAEVHRLPDGKGEQSYGRT